MAKFKLQQRVRKIGTKEVRTVEEIREGAGTEPTYSIQLGSDFATRIWAKESELEAVPKSRSEAADGRHRIHGSKSEDEELTNDLIQQLEKDNRPKRGDTVVFPAAHRAKIHSVYDEMIWLMNSDGSDTEGAHIPVGDVTPSDEPNTWLYKDSREVSRPGLYTQGH
ncbi:MAG TPA: hypothetical protein VK722_22550 [Candidatus Aquilonibacter sp.]|jgi:hypothetical protein|nr:hypothetical protein [Candidatus Aquilonibacter sp.]